MIKFKNSVGWTVYKITAAECYSFGGLAICDECNTHCPEGGYLIPVLNHFMCPSCYKEWSSFCTFYPEDLEFERNVCFYYENMLSFVVSDVPV